MTKFFVLIIVVVCVVQSCVPVKENTDAIYTVSKFQSQLKEGAIVHLPTGKHKLTKTIKLIDQENDVQIIGAPNCTVDITKPFLEVSSKILYKGILSESLAIGDKFVKINCENCSVGDVITFRSGEVIETAWNTKAFHTTSIKAKNSTEVELAESLRLPFKVSNNASVTIRKKIEVRIENIKFNLIDVPTGSRAITVTGAKVSTNQLGADTNGGKSLDFIELRGCDNSSINYSKLKGFRYGFLVNYSSNTSIANLVADDCYHGVAPASWSYNTVTKYYSGTNTRIDAHPSFNTTYENVNIECGKYLPNCRALGVRLKNCTLKSEYAGKGKFYIGPLHLAKEYQFLAKEYDIILDKVTYIQLPNNPINLSIYSARNVHIDQFSGYGLNQKSRSNSFELMGSRLNYLSVHAEKTRVVNSRFESKVSSANLGANPPILIKSSGEVQFTECQFKANSLPLIRTVAKVQPIFKSCDFRGISRMFDDKSLEKKSKAQFENCKFHTVSGKSITKLPE